MNKSESDRLELHKGGTGWCGLVCLETRSGSPGPEFYSRIGFVQEFRRLDGAQITGLLKHLGPRQASHS